MSPKNKIALRRILIFIVLWLILGLTYIILERGILGNTKIYPATGNPYDFRGALLSIFPGSMIMGGLFGSLEVFIINKFLSRKPFFIKLILKGLIYLTILMLFLIIMTIFSNAYQLQLSVTDPIVIDKLKAFTSNTAFWSVIMYASIGTMAAVFISEVSNYLGPNVLENFINGKYHKPREESRIFMFLDMKSSTSIAEDLGHVKYFNFLNQYFADLTEPIIDSEGEIYQYVGDEIVASWEMNEKDNRPKAIMAFFSAKELLKAKEEKYKNEFGIVPEFKAGIHGGKVSTGQIGTIKKDIVFSGDVLNTAARIQSLCNTYNSELLVSQWIIEHSRLSDYLRVKEIGHLQLKGKTEEVKVYSITNTENEIS